VGGGASRPAAYSHDAWCVRAGSVPGRIGAARLQQAPELTTRVRQDTTRGAPPPGYDSRLRQTRHGQQPGFRSAHPLRHHPGFGEQSVTVSNLGYGSIRSGEQPGYC